MKSDMPKVLHKVCGKPMLEYVLDSCRAAGCDRLICVVGHEMQQIHDEFAGRDGDIVWVEQARQLGTGHAVMVCREQLEQISGPVLILGGDGPLVRPETLSELLAVHNAQGAACTLATSIMADPGKYGRIVRDENGEMAGIVEFIEADEKQREIKEVNVSLYCFDAESLAGVLDGLTNDNAKGEYYLTDTLTLLRNAGRKLAAVASVPPEDTASINTLDELEQVEQALAGRLEQNNG